MWDELIQQTENQIRLGAGQKADPEAVNVDVRDLDGIDIVHDLTKFPWTIDSNQFDIIVARDVIEHIPPRRKNGKDLLVQFIEEVYRIAKPDSKALFKFPHPQEKHQYGDPTHYRFMKPHMFSHFCPDGGRWRKSIHTDAKFKMVSDKYINHNFKVILDVLK